MAKSRRVQRLTVFQNGQEVGVLERAINGAVSFNYSSTWLDRDDATPISLSLPLRETPYSGTEASYFFDNLLPDNDAIRRKIASQVKAASERPFDLLHSIGQDCVGSLQFLTEQSPLPKKEIHKSSPLKEDEIAKMLKSLDFFPLGMHPDESEFRLSIAGAQEKTALLRIKGRWHKPHGSTPTTHILKPPMGILHSGIDLRTSVENEWLCLQICRELGFEVANCQMASFEDQKCLVVERFDRKWNSPSQLMRIPQEDLCQALGFPPSKRYQADGGPGVVEIMDFLNASDERRKDRSNFMRAQIVFYLLAATDGHAKNFSTFLTKSGFRLTPLYDVMTVFPAISKKQIHFQKAKLAMAVAKHYHLSKIARRHFESMAKACGFPLKELAQLIEEIRDAVPKIESKIKIPSDFPQDLLEVTFKGIKTQAERF